MARIVQFNSPTALSKRRQIRALENELDKHVEAERKAKDGKERIRHQLRTLRGR